MSGEDRRALVRVGETAPDFVVEMVTSEGAASLHDYRGRTSVLLALFRGLQCSFCRQHIALLGQAREKFRDAGFEVLAVTASSPDRVRRYLQFRPMKVALAADPERVTHRRYGLPSSVEQGMSIETLQEWFRKEYGAMARARGATISDTMSWRDIIETANRLDGYEMTHRRSRAGTRRRPHRAVPHRPRRRRPLDEPRRGDHAWNGRLSQRTGADRGGATPEGGVIVDIHAHYFPKAYNDPCCASAGAACRRPRGRSRRGRCGTTIPSGIPTRLQQMDEAGVQLQVLSPAGEPALRREGGRRRRGGAAHQRHLRRARRRSTRAGSTPSSRCRCPTSMPRCARWSAGSTSSACSACR